MSVTQKRCKTAELRARVSAKLKGIKRSPETRAKMRIAERRPGEISVDAYSTRRGRKRSPEARARISAGVTGRPLSAEARAKLSRISRDKNYKHGLSRHLLYAMYNNMMQRCYKVKWHNYSKYGGLGVTVWEPWRDPRTFIFGLWALLGECPEGYSLDRINPHGDYVEWNVRWADTKTQSRNIRKNIADYDPQCGEH
jgi:NUMOD3 motif